MLKDNTVGTVEIWVWYIINTFRSPSLILTDIELSRGNLVFSNEILFSWEKLKTKVCKSRLANYTKCPLRAYYLKQVCLIVQSIMCVITSHSEKGFVFMITALQWGVVIGAWSSQRSVFTPCSGKTPCSIVRSVTLCWTETTICRAHWDEVSNCFHSPSSCHFYTEPSSTLQA